MPGLHISPASDPDACRAVEDVQREVWGLPERAVVPAEQVRAAVHNGGSLLLAHDGDTLVGFCYAFVGVEDGRPLWCSHMLAVRPPWRGRGIGRALKLAQRDQARERGIRRITWTFDPLQARNAHLNLHRLRAHARRYYVNHYGAMQDDINRGMPTDRLLAEWPVDPTGDAAPANPPDPPTPADPPDPVAWILPADTTGARPRPGAVITEVPAAGGLVAVPSDLDDLRTDPALLDAWRTAVREALRDAFAAGLVAVDLRRDAACGVAAYVLGHLP